MKKYLLILLSLLFAVVGYSQSFSVSIDKKAILIGEKIQLNVKGSFPKGQPVRWINIDTITHFEIMEKSRIDSQILNDKVILSQVYTITSWDSGKWVIPSYKFLNIPSPIHVVVVGYTPFDVTQPYNDIKDILEVEDAERTTWHWYLLVALLIVLLFLLFFPAAKKQQIKVSEIDPGAYKKALNELEALRVSELHKKDVKAFYTSLIRIFRTYLSSGKGIQSFTKTTDDLSIQLLQVKLTHQFYNELVQVLRLSDLVKFAEYNAAQNESQLAFEVINDSISKIENAV